MKPLRRHLLRGIAALALVLATGTLHAQTSAPLWILVDTQAHVLSLMRGDTAVATYANVAIGSGGTTREKYRGDQKTPLGEFHISEIRTSERFHLFIAIDYPTLEDADRAHQAGRLGDTEWRRIREARLAGRQAPPDTALGGQIGIHGIGIGDPWIHEIANWTNGCIALTDAQVDALAAQVSTGMRVKIR